VFILKEVKVVCFDTLLQVLILKGVNGSGEWRVASGEEDLGGGVTPLSRVFAYERQGKDLRDRECVRVAGKGLTEGHFCASVQRPSRRGTPTPGVLGKEAASC
jgi:hypothetical protein